MTFLQGYQVVPNLANIAKNHRFPKYLPIFLAIFYATNLPLFEIPIVNIDKTIHSALFINCIPKR